MSRVCKVCTRKISGGTCPVCGYTNAVVLTDSERETEMLAAKAYRAELLAGVKNFSVNAFTLQWDEATCSYKETGRQKIIIANGSDCDSIVCWSDTEFAQSPLEVIPPLDLDISYEMNGHNVKAPVRIQPVRCKDFWHIGIQINPDLTFSVFLGTKDCVAQATGDSLI